MYELSSFELSSSISRKLFTWFDDLVSFPKQGDFLLMYVLNPIWFIDPSSDAVPVRAARPGLSDRVYPRDSHCRGAHMHTDLRRVFSSVGSFDCQGTGKIKESLPQM